MEIKIVIDSKIVADRSGLIPLYVVTLGEQGRGDYG
jgi:hypothetical protein